MPISVLFWVLMVLWFIFSSWNGFLAGDKKVIGGNLLMFALFAILGWRVFGPVVQNS